MTISIDIDGVLANFTDGLSAVANKLWPGKVPEKYEPSTWGYDDMFTKDEFSAIWSGIKASYDFWRYLKPYKENVNALRNFFLYESGHDVFYITSRVSSRGCSVEHQTRGFLRNNAIWDPETNSTSLLVVAKPEAKQALMAALDIKYSIDDYGPTVEQCNKLAGHTAYLLDRPWNRDTDYGPRVGSIVQFLDTIRQQEGRL